MSENIEKLKNKLYELISKDNSLYDDEILEVSRELDEEIVFYYLTGMEHIS